MRSVSVLQKHWKTFALTRRRFVTSQSSGSNFYSVLGVSENATNDQIKKAWMEKVKLYHPDVNKEPSAHQKFIELTKAFETLKDDSKRRHYDQERKPSSYSRATSHYQQQQQQQQQQQHTGHHYSYAKQNDGDSINEQLFRRTKATQRKAADAYTWDEYHSNYWGAYYDFSKSKDQPKNPNNSNNNNSNSNNSSNNNSTTNQQRYQSSYSPPPPPNNRTNVHSHNLNSEGELSSNRSRSLVYTFALVWTATILFQLLFSGSDKKKERKNNDNSELERKMTSTKKTNITTPTQAATATATTTTAISHHHHPHNDSNTNSNGSSNSNNSQNEISTPKSIQDQQKEARRKEIQKIYTAHPQIAEVGKSTTPQLPPSQLQQQSLTNERPNNEINLNVNVVKQVSPNVIQTRNELENLNRNKASVEIRNILESTTTTAPPTQTLNARHNMHQSTNVNNELISSKPTSNQ